MTIKTKAEEQLRAIFGENYEPMRDASFARNDDALENDLRKAIGFDPSLVSSAVQSLFDSMELSHSQQAMVLSDVMAKQGAKCVIADVINVRALESNLAASVVRAANKAGADYREVLESVLSNVEDNAALAASMI